MRECVSERVMETGVGAHSDPDGLGARQCRKGHAFAYSHGSSPGLGVREQCPGGLEKGMAQHDGSMDQEMAVESEGKETVEREEKKT